MSSIAAVAGTDLWNAEVYGAMSVASRVSASVKQQLSVFQLAPKLWNLDRNMKRFLETLYYKVEHPDNPPPPLDRDAALNSAFELRKLHATIEQLFLTARAKGLTNRTLTNGSLTSIRARSAHFIELAEWIEEALTDPSVDAAFERSLEELKRGDVFDLPRLK